MTDVHINRIIFFSTVLANLLFGCTEAGNPHYLEAKYKARQRKWCVFRCTELYTFLNEYHFWFYFLLYFLKGIDTHPRPRWQEQCASSTRSWAWWENIATVTNLRWTLRVWPTWQVREKKPNSPLITIWSTLFLMCAHMPVAALLTVSEEVRSRCSLKHRKSLLLSDVTMENFPVDTYSVYHPEPGCRWDRQHPVLLFMKRTKQYWEDHLTTGASFFHHLKCFHTARCQLGFELYSV